MTAPDLFAGIGLREAALPDDLRDLLALAPAPLAGLATLAEKARHPALAALCRETGLPLREIARADLAAVPTLTRSPGQIARFGTGSLAEACALLAAGPGARLTGPRQIAHSGRATIAFAERNPA
ncbi:cobalamin biosynthesis protein [Paracoccus aminophilus]|nr:cobalamin biosynthesis protein [Paracoccus aminophilus]